DEERALWVPAPHDAVDAARKVVHVHLALIVRPRALRPGRKARAHVRLAPRARPEVTTRTALRGADLRDGPGARVPGEGGERVEAAVLERVVLVPDEPAAVEAPVGLIVLRARKAAD